MITIYTIAYNEEVMLPFFIKWYRERFPDCKIVVYDNYSTDNTEKIALENKCEVIKYDTGNKLSDSKYLEIKNNCWKNAETDWVLVCDADEMLDVFEKDLKNIKETIIQGKGYNMYNIEEEESLENMIYGSRAKQYDKYLLFNKKFITEINYSPGCHTAFPKGSVAINNTFNLYHYSWLGVNYVFNKYQRNKQRLSEENIKNNWGFHYKDSFEKIQSYFDVAKNFYSKKENIDGKNNIEFRHNFMSNGL